ncbi:MAG: glutathione peroxidase [Spirochaetia bacterium]|nr:glutathione peroxidase [Spirochaetia bacterium]
MIENIYQFEAKDIKGENIILSKYKQKVLLIVNTASKCGFTKQYAGLESLYQKYKNKDFLVLGFPCNQFGGQEPENEAAILKFCSINYNVSFPMFSKINVNGKEAHPLYKYLKENLPGIIGTERIKWNFTKFLIDKAGKPVKRFASKVKPEEIEKDIEKLLTID